MLYMYNISTYIFFRGGDISNHKQLQVPGFVKPTTGATLQILIPTRPELPDSAGTCYVYNAPKIHVDFCQEVHQRGTGTSNFRKVHVVNAVNFQFSGYVFRRTVDGIHIIHLGKTWEKIQVAARVFDIFKLFVVFSR